MVSVPLGERQVVPGLRAHPPHVGLVVELRDETERLAERFDLEPIKPIETPPTAPFGWPSPA
jgi:hypothetical protein